MSTKVSEVLSAMVPSLCFFQCLLATNYAILAIDGVIQGIVSSLSIKGSSGAKFNTKFGEDETPPWPRG